MERWNGRIAFVTGASKGIGASICRQLVKHGMIVIGCARNVALIKAIAKEEKDKSTGELHAMKCDLSNEIEILAMFRDIRSAFGHIDVCVNNAGFCSTRSLRGCTTKDLKNLLEENIIALSICTRESLQLMAENNITDGVIIQVVQFGSIIHHDISSAPSKPSPGYSMYMGVNLIIRAFTETLREGLKQKGICTACISPGSAVIEFLLGRMSPEEAKNKFLYAKRSEAEVITDYVISILSTPTGETVQDVILEAIEFHA